MKKSKLIIFDWGDIVDSHFKGYSCLNAWGKLFERLGYEGGREIYAEMERHDMTSIGNWEEFERVYNKIRDKFSLNADFQEFLRLQKECFEGVYFYEDTRDYELSLASRCYIGILSDLTLLDHDRLDSQVGLSNYDYVFLSYEMGMSKPDPALFEYIQNKLPFDKKDILFIDDNFNNTNAAKEFGWNVLTAMGEELPAIKEACEAFLAD